MTATGLLGLVLVVVPAVGLRNCPHEPLSLGKASSLCRYLGITMGRNKVLLVIVELLLSLVRLIVEITRTPQIISWTTTV